jgi:hypothetical protein
MMSICHTSPGPTHLQRALGVALNNVLAGRDSLFQYEFSTPKGEISVLAVVEVNAGMILLNDVCIYATQDPPGIPRGSIAAHLRGQLQELASAGLHFGYAAVCVQGVRVIGSSSAKPGKMVNIKRKGKS